MADRTRRSVSLALLALCGTPLSAQTTQPIPLTQGLMITNAIANPRGDYESHLRIDKVDDKAVYIVYTAPRTLRRRTVRHVDLDTSRHFQQRFGGNYPSLIPGSTGLGTSRLVLTDLKNKGRAEFSCCFLTKYDRAQYSGTLTVVEPRRVLMPVIVNDRRVELPAIHATGRLGNKETEFYFLDDPANPLALQWKVGNQGLRLVKISFPTKTSATRIEQALANTGRVEVYGIYFDFGSATIKPESDVVLKEIAGAMSKNPKWKLNVEGHTDNVGGDAPNLELSRRRAASVKDALVTRYGIAGERLATSGFGSSRPKETNATLEGRARNRRVELVRH